MNMKQSCKALICAIEGELDGRHCTEEQAAAILDHALPSLTEALARAQSELAEAVGLLRYSQEIARLFDDEHTAEVGRFLSRHAQAEQQEAQDAQAGDELDAIAEAIFNADKDNWYSAGPYPQLHANDKARLRAMARAALATQPATGEPAKYWAFHNEFGELRIEDRWDVAKHLPFDLIPLITLITPPAAAHGGITAEVLAPFLAVADSYDPAEDDAHVPAKDWMMDDALRLTLGQFRALKRAAAHGDEGVRKDAERYRWLMRQLAFVRNESDEKGTRLFSLVFKFPVEEWRDCVADIKAAAMRAQGDGD